MLLEERLEESVNSEPSEDFMVKGAGTFRDIYPQGQSPDLVGRGKGTGRGPVTVIKYHYHYS